MATPHLMAYQHDRAGHASRNSRSVRRRRERHSSRPAGGRAELPGTTALRSLRAYMQGDRRRPKPDTAAESGASASHAASASRYGRSLAGSRMRNQTYTRL